MLTDDQKFWDAVWSIAEFPLTSETDDQVRWLMNDAQRLMRRRAQELRQRAEAQAQWR
jgi:hypothetical protein